MKVNIEKHLTKEQILQAVVDIADLSHQAQTHLLSCAVCNNAKMQIEGTFQALGKQAAAAVPIPKTRLPILLEKRKQSLRWFAQWRTSIGIAITALLMVCIIWGSNLLRVVPGQSTADQIMEVHEVEVLIQEVNMLAENALPPVYLELSKELETESDFNELYIEYIVPLVDEESLSFRPREKGLIV